MNITIANVNLLNQNTVTVAVPIQVAANICGVSVLAVVSGPVTCTTSTNGTQTVTITPPAA
ncbi:MAG: hypothetical protein LC749_18235 [Actinobacteria bacterium]|nr:hypothetical protein [Actinomycetota bacterium]